MNIEQLAVDMGSNALDIESWADAVVEDGLSRLIVHHGERPTAVHGARGASGQGLVSNGAIGADLLRVPAGSGFVPHTHPGHHVLVIVAGRGTITFGGRVHETSAGGIYLVPGQVPHAVGAITDHVILAVGAPHKAVDAEDRMLAVPYQEVQAPEGDLTCLICGVSSRLPERLHDVSCTHCPCYACLEAG